MVDQCWSVPLKCCTFEIMRNQTVSETLNGVELAALFIPAGSGCFLQSGQNNLSSTFLEVWPMKCPFLLQPTAWNSTCLSEALAFCSVFCPVACEMKRQFIVNSSSDTSVYRMTGSIRRQSFSTCRRTTSESADCQWLPCSLAAWCLRAALQALHHGRPSTLLRWHSLSCWLRILETGPFWETNAESSGNRSFYYLYWKPALKSSMFLLSLILAVKLPGCQESNNNMSSSPYGIIRVSKI